jgi:hypothetical protein
MLTRVDPHAWNAAGFDGPLYRPGAKVTDAELGEAPVALECAGPQGNWHRGKDRRTLWILWRYDRGESSWVEIARALSLSWDWAVILREPAILALSRAISADGVVDLAKRGREVAEELLRAIDSTLLSEPAAVRTMALTSIYDQVAGRIVLA